MSDRETRQLILNEILRNPVDIPPEEYEEIMRFRHRVNNRREKKNKWRNK